MLPPRCACQDQVPISALSAMSIFKLFEAQKYCSTTNHMLDGFWFLANRRPCERLPEPIREITAKHLNSAAITLRADMASLNTNLQKQLTAKEMVFNAPCAELFREKLRLAGCHNDWKAKFGYNAWAILERAIGKLSCWCSNDEQHKRHRCNCSSVCGRGSEKKCLSI